MSRLPRRLEPWWPVLKRWHLRATLAVGWLFRRAGFAFGDRGLPRHAFATSAASAAADPSRVILHRAASGEQLRRAQAVGRPPDHLTFTSARDFDVPPTSVLELRGGTSVGPYGATITPDGGFDFETSRYFSVYRWQEHPLFLRARLPVPHHVAGTVVSLATRGGDRNYYHFVLEVLPRWAITRQLLPDVIPDAVYVPHALGYERELLALTGIDTVPLLSTATVAAVSADRLLVPSYPNLGEMQPSWLVSWVRDTLLPSRPEGRPKRIFVTRGGAPHTRRLERGPEIAALLESQGFTTIDPGAMTVQEQIDHFAAAEVVVGIHGAGLTNLVFAPPGVRVLELFAPTYVKHCYWALTDQIPGSTYRYLIGDGPGPTPGQPMLGLQDDIDLAPGRVAEALADLLSASG